MIYQTGKMGIAEGVALCFILNIPRVFLSTPSVQLDFAASLAWLVPLINAGGAYFGFLVLVQVLNRHGGDLYSVSELLLGRYLAIAIAAFYSGYFFLNAVLLLRQFAENTLITALPQLEFRVAIAIYALISAIIVTKGLEGLARTSWLLMPFGVLPLILVLLLLVPFYNVDHLFPWQGMGFAKVIPQALLGASIDGGVIALIILAVPLQNLHTVKTAGAYGLFSCALLKAFCNLVFTLVLGYAAGREKVLPFFEMARLVYLSRYVQRIEALFILLWVIYGMLGIAAYLYMTCYLFTRLFRLPALRPIVPAIALSMAFLSMLPSDVTDTLRFNYFFLQTYAPIGIYVLPVLLLMASFFKGKKRKGAKPCAADSPSS